MIIAAAPFLLILLAMCFSLMKELRNEPDDATTSPKVRAALKSNDRSQGHNDTPQAAGPKSPVRTG